MVGDRVTLGEGFVLRGRFEAAVRSSEALRFRPVRGAAKSSSSSSIALSEASLDWGVSSIETGASDAEHWELYATADRVKRPGSLIFAARRGIWRDG